MAATIPPPDSVKASGQPPGTSLPGSRARINPDQRNGASAETSPPRITVTLNRSAPEIGTGDPIASRAVQ